MAATLTGHDGTPVVFIHGLWLHPTSWHAWEELFQANGYRTAAPGWPGVQDTVEATRADPNVVADPGIERITRHYARIIADLPEPPVLIGHSIGGLIAQKLLAMGYGRAAVAIDSAQFKGVMRATPSSVKAAMPILRNPANRHKAVSLTEAQFRYAFGNTLTEQQSNELYRRWAVPSPARPLFEATSANFARHTAAAVAAEGEVSRPLLLIMGGEDHAVPESVTRSAYRFYRDSAVADLMEFRDRGHSLTIDSGWREVADACLTWLADHASAMDEAAEIAAVSGPEPIAGRERKITPSPRATATAPSPTPALTLEPEDDQVLIDVQCVGICDWDDVSRAGGWQGGLGELSALGAQVAGTVVKSGPEAEGFAPGTEVLTHTYPLEGSGPRTRRVLAPSSHVALKPPGLTWQYAAALPMPALTAYELLFEVLQVRSGETLLVHGAEGIIGGLLVQIAAANGLHVVATAELPCVAQTAALGAAAVVDRDDPDWPEEARRLLGGRGADAAAVATSHGTAAALSVVRDHGRMTTIADPTPPPPERGIKPQYVRVHPDGELLGRAAEALNRGEIYLPEPAEFDMADIDQALATLLAGSGQTPVVLSAA